MPQQGNHRIPLTPALSLQGLRTRHFCAGEAKGHCRQRACQPTPAYGHPSQEGNPRPPSPPRRGAASAAGWVALSARSETHPGLRPPLPGGESPPPIPSSEGCRVSGGVGCPIGSIRNPPRPTATPPRRGIPAPHPLLGGVPRQRRGGLPYRLDPKPTPAYGHPSQEGKEGAKTSHPDTRLLTEAAGLLNTAESQARNSARRTQNFTLRHATNIDSKRTKLVESPPCSTSR